MRCSYCHDSLVTLTSACRDCATQLHLECWGLAGDCPSLGCEGSPAPRRPRGWILGWLLCLLPVLLEVKPTLDRLVRRPYDSYGCCFYWPPAAREPSLERAPAYPDPLKVLVRTLGAAKTQIPSLPVSWPQDLTVLEEIRERRRRRS